MALETDVLVIGAGPAGYVGAIKLGQFGKKVVLVDKDKLGGECLNYGCIPSKALINASDQFHEAKNSAPRGFEASRATLDWGKTQAWKTQLIGGFNRGIASLIKSRGVSFINGEAAFTGPNSARVTTANGPQDVSFKNALICVGTRPVTLPDFPIDGDKILTSKEALDLREPPGRMLVIGAGVIGLEIGTLFAKLGTRVTVVEFLPQILPGIDPDLSAPVERKLGKLGVEILLQTKAKSFKNSKDGLEVALETPNGPKTVQADKILTAIGRAPIAKSLALESCGVETGPKGHILVDEHFRSKAPHIYAAGDVVGPPYLAHKASREAILAATDMCGFSAEPRGAVPWAVFTDPEISFVGETEAEARARGASVSVGRFPFSASGRAQTAARPEGFAKAVVDKESHRILGAGFVGPHASDLISEAALAVRLQATVEDVAATIHPHPTLPEAFQEAAEAALGEAIHVLSKV